MALTPERVLDALRTVRDPDLGKDLVTLGCTQYVEAGPGKQLKAMMRRIDQDAWGKCITLDQT